MSGRVEVTSRADADLENQAEYFQRSSPRTAQRFIQSAWDSFRLLASMPEMGAACGFSSPAAAGVRFWAVSGFRKHLIFYRPLPDGIEVLRVLHGARDLERAFHSPP